MLSPADSKTSPTNEAEREGTKKTRHGSDQRLLLLILAGITLLLPHLAATISPLSPDVNRPPGSEQRLAWLESTDTRPNGFYWLDGAIGPGPTRSNSPAGQVNEFPQSSQLPAQVAPILFQPLPINRADRDTLMIIPGIGSQLAGAIIAYRDRVGRIKDRAALMRIEGIGDKKADLIESYVTFDE